MNAATKPQALMASPRKLFAAGVLFAFVLVGGLRLPSAYAGANVYQDMEASFKQADARLNIVYKGLLQSIAKAQVRENLVQAQRAWIVFRDAEADFQTSLDNKGGMVAAYGRLEEQTKLTKQRIQELEQIKAEQAD